MDKMDSLEEKLEEFKESYSKTKYSKATNKYLGILRAKIAEVKREIVEAGKRPKGSGFFVKKSGDATVALLGFPSAGKSSLLNLLANTKSKTASYAFTTTTIIPGMMVYNDAHIQVFDMPGIIEDAHKGIGGGRSVISALRVADLIIFVIDAENPRQMDLLMRELNALDIRVNKRRPGVSIVRLPGNASTTVELNRSGLPDEEVEAVLAEFRINNAVVKIGDRMGVDELISIVAGKALYMGGIIALNKIDRVARHEKLAKELSQRWGMDVVPISATKGTNIKRLREAVYKNLGIMKVYLSPDGKEMNPIILRTGTTVSGAARRLHTELMDVMKAGYVTGPSAKFERQRVGAAHVLKEGDKLTFIRGDA
jgi:ribosome-interacting GTPase 1